MKITKRYLQRVVTEAVRSKVDNWDVVGVEVTWKDAPPGTPTVIEIPHWSDFVEDHRDYPNHPGRSEGLNTIYQAEDSEDISWGVEEYLSELYPGLVWDSWKEIDGPGKSTNEATIKITKRQLRRIIEQASSASSEGLEPARFRSKEDAEDMAVGMVFGEEPNVRLGGKLPWEVRIISIDGEYALYAMRDHSDRYAGAGKEYAAVPRGGEIRYGRRIG